MSEISTAKNNSTQIDMATELKDIFVKNIAHVSFGDDLSDDPIEIKVREG